MASPETLTAIDEFRGRLRTVVRTTLAVEEGEDMSATTKQNEGTDRDTWEFTENGNEDPNFVPAMSSEEKVFASLADFTSSTLQLDTFYIKEIDKHVRLRYLTASEVDRYRQSLIVGKGTNIQINQRGARAKLAVMALANEDGTRLLQDKDIPEVMKWHSVILERISDRVKAKNGITDDDLGGDDVGN